jgi:hypothetical protein
MPSDGKSSHCFWQSELKISLREILSISVTHDDSKTMDSDLCSEIQNCYKSAVPLLAFVSKCNVG